MIYSKLYILSTLKTLTLYCGTHNCVCNSYCNNLANISFTRPRVSPIFLTRLHETTRPGAFLIIHFVFQYQLNNCRIAVHLKTKVVFYDINSCLVSFFCANAFLSSIAINSDLINLSSITKKIPHYKGLANQAIFHAVVPL